MKEKHDFVLAKLAGQNWVGGCVLEERPEVI